jgi:hypothetical protein
MAPPDPKRVRGTVINVHALGATVRLEDGRLMAVPISDVNANRAAYTRALDARTPAPAPAPVLHDPAFEAQINDYLKSTEEWAPPDRPQPFERHLFRKKQRAKIFRGENSSSGEHSR